MKVFVTGASGFIGKILIGALRDHGHAVSASSRTVVEEHGIFCVRSPELGPVTDWTASLAGIDAVVHLAGLSQITSGKFDAKTEKKYLRINAEGTRRLAAQCVEAGVKHFLFLSSCHAVAAESEDLLMDHTVPKPSSIYGRSKLAAEEAIKEAFAESECAWTILRPPLVYGPSNKANFGLLIKLVKSGVPLPLASVSNRRSFIYVENLADLIATCLETPKAFGKTFYPSDGEDVSTPELIQSIAKANQVFYSSGVSLEEKAEIMKIEKLRYASAARLFPFPENSLKALGCLPGLGILRKLTSSLYVDSEPVRNDLDWTPPFSMEEGLRRTLIKGV